MGILTCLIVSAISLLSIKPDDGAQGRLMKPPTFVVKPVVLPVDSLPDQFALVWSLNIDEFGRLAQPWGGSPTDLEDIPQLMRCSLIQREGKGAVVNLFMTDSRQTKRDEVDKIIEAFRLAADPKRKTIVYFHMPREWYKKNWSKLKINK